MRPLVGICFTILFGVNFDLFSGVAQDVPSPYPSKPHSIVGDTNQYIHVASIARMRQGKPGNGDPYTFPVSRFDPIKYYDSLRISWLEKEYRAEPFIITAQPEEYLAYQVGVWAIEREAKDIQVRFEDLTSADGRIISRYRMTCFNLEGRDYRGCPFLKSVDVQSGRVQPLWMGIDLREIPAGRYEGVVEVGTPGDMRPTSLVIEVSGAAVANRGFNDDSRLARLAWLNCTAGINEQCTKGYPDIGRRSNRIEILGRHVVLDSSGLPGEMLSFFEPSNQFLLDQAASLIDSPFRFIVELEGGSTVALVPGLLTYKNQTRSGIEWEVNNTSEDCNLLVEGRMEFDGFLEYKLTLTANRALQVRDIRMEIPVSSDQAEYMMGLNHEGGRRPEEVLWQWDTTRNQDMLWIGAVNGGMRIKWKAENYVRPLVNIYYGFNPLRMPPSWGNGGKGGVRVQEEGHAVTVTAFSGRREMAPSDQLHYDLELLITPFRTINKSVQFGDRYFHGGGSMASSKVDIAGKAGANIINIHHAEDIYPFINYPYLDANRDALQQLVDAAHGADMRLKLYYTTRELTINAPEFWAFYSLDGGLIFPGPGNASRTLLHRDGPHAWLKENLRERYIPAWYNPITEGKFKGAFDMSVITTPDSRLNNFYIGGLNWMVQNLGIDGVYIDDSALDRITLRRARKIIDAYRPQGRMDLHSWNHFNEHAGYASCLNLYMDLLPYFDLTWIGEGRDYDRMPDHWLIEVSGIPFGIPGQMLQDGGNLWRGMVYGMTNRAGWGGDPSNIWQFWDAYTIEEKQMIGYWDDRSPVKVDNPRIRATVYRGGKESIIAVANWDSEVQEYTLELDWKALGYDMDGITTEMPSIQDFQAAKTLHSLEGIRVPGGKGHLIVVRDTDKKK